MNSAAINRQFLMGAVISACPSISGSIHRVVPHTEVVLIGDLTQIFTQELSMVPYDTTGALDILNSHTDNVGIWLNNFCQYVLPHLKQKVVPQGNGA